MKGVIVFHKTTFDMKLKLQNVALETFLGNIMKLTLGITPELHNILLEEAAFSSFRCFNLFLILQNALKLKLQQM